MSEKGEGWDKIIKEHDTHPLKPKLPKIEADAYSVLVEIFSTREKFEREKTVEEKLELNQRQKKAIEFIKQHGEISRKRYADLAVISIRQANRDLNDLLTKKVVVSVGRGRSLRYKWND